MKRGDYSKSSKAPCKECGQELHTTGLSSHIKWNHGDIGGIDGYVKKHGEFRAIKEAKKKKRVRETSRVVCALCGDDYSSNGMYTHLRDSHSMTVEDYISKHGEYRKKYIDYNKRALKNKIKCLVCNDLFGSERLLTHHIERDHGIKKRQYVKDYVFVDGPPKCICGCGEDVSMVNQPPYRRDYVAGHVSAHNNGMSGKTHKESSKAIMSDKAMDRIASGVNSSDTEPELQFKDVLNKLGVQFEHQVKTNAGVIDFYIPSEDIFVEIDGEYWHPIVKEGLNIQLISSSVSEMRKDLSITNLYRIRASDVPKIQTISDIYELHTVTENTVRYRQKISSKEYFQYIIDSGDMDTLKKYIPKILEFIRLYQPEFPYPTTTEDINKVVDTIRGYDMNRVVDGKVFKNNCYSIGVSLLKSTFKSYWNSKYNDSKTPIDAWNDDAIMRKIIAYRIGCNSSGEVFDLSLHQLIRGISAARYTISFFKPLLAAAVYKQFLGDRSTPTVIDPCAGFGGRMLGFKAVYPNGTYIGIEPNIDTYNELKELSKHFSNIELHNCKLEDYVGSKECDLTFTSIPYSNVEIYSNHVDYENESVWEREFIGGLLTFRNLLVNVPMDMERLFPNHTNKYYLRNNTSHFDKSANSKFELILKHF